MTTAEFRREDRGVYLVVAPGERVVGEVRQAWFASHIRRGRMQTSPWWQARHVSGMPVLVDGRDAWQTRREAGEALLRDVERLTPAERGEPYAWTRP